MAHDEESRDPHATALYCCNLRISIQKNWERVHWKEKRDEIYESFHVLFVPLWWFGGYQEKSKSPNEWMPTKGLHKTWTKPNRERKECDGSIIGQCDLWTEHRLPWLLLLPSLRPEDLPIPNPLIYDPFTNSFVFFARTRFWSYSWWA